MRILKSISNIFGTILIIAGIASAIIVMSSKYAELFMFIPSFLLIGIGSLFLDSKT